MVGKTKLIRTTGSPLIGGFTQRRSGARRVIAPVAALVAVAIAVALFWYFVIR